MTQRSGALLLAVALCSFAACDNDTDDTDSDAGAEAGGKGGSGNASGSGGKGGAGGSNTGGKGGAGGTSSGGSGGSGESDNAGGSGGAGGANAENSKLKDEATKGVKDYVVKNLDELVTASEDLQKAAPEDHGWDDKDPAMEPMRKAWKTARSAYERIEGPIATLFSELDVSTDARYDAFLEEVTDKKYDTNLFDGEGVTGMHAIERILYSNQTPGYVVDFEKALEGYKAAAFPTSKEEATEFKNGLCKRLVDDVKSMRQMYVDGVGDVLDVDTAFVGMIASTTEQSEKTIKAATGEDESRYSQNTMADMRANLEGAKAVYEAFKPWIEDTKGNVEGIDKALQTTADAYAEVKGDALPMVPEKFNPDSPTDDDLKTPFGKLWKLLQDETDPEKEGSLVSYFTDAADKMGIKGVEAE